jgi:hypothetical protein
MQHVLKAKRTGIMDDFVLGRDLTQCKFETQVQEVEAKWQAEWMGVQESILVE